MSWVVVGVGVAGAVVGGVASNQAAKKGAAATDRASAAQQESALAGIEEQQRQFDSVRALLSPYVQAGNTGLTGMQRLMGASGDYAQQEMINQIEKSAGFRSTVKQGENAILQNASATGGLRGGNTQGALAQFRPAALAAAIDQQYQRYAGLSSLGQNAAAGVGNAGMQTGGNIASLLQQQGAAQAGGILGQGRAQQQAISGIGNAFGGAIGAAGPALAQYYQQQQGITGTSGGNAGAYSTGTTLNNNFGGGATYF